jgi:short-subunit dehydrogenase
MTELKGKRVLITGGSSGIGRALALEFAKRGAVLAIVSRRLEKLVEAGRDIRLAYPDGAPPLAIPCDVTDGESVGRLIKSCVDRWGGLDILVNNAGIGVYGDADRTSLEDFRAIMEVNYFGALQSTMNVLPFMRKAGQGLIVNITSIAAKHGVPYLAAYSASKAALAALSQSLRAELAQSGISLMIVYPGYTETDFFTTEKKVGGAVRPSKPYAPPEKVARAILKAIEREKHNVVLSPEGRALALFEKIFPRLVEAAMRRIAVKLRDPKEAVYEKT